MIHWLVDWLIYDLMMGKQNIKQQIHGHILRAIVYFQLLPNADEIARIIIVIILWDHLPATHSHQTSWLHDDVIKWKHFPRNWPFVRGIHRSPVNSPHKGQWRGALMFTLICVWINDWVNNREAGDLRRYRAHCDVIVRAECYIAKSWMCRRVIYQISDAIK